MGFKVYEKCCQNCLLSPDAIVSPERVTQIIGDCAQNDNHFTCHKASMEDKDICCRRFYDEFGHVGKLLRMAKHWNVVEFIPQPDSEKFTSYKELNEKSKR
jgi:hypothetical protein